MKNRGMDRRGWFEGSKVVTASFAVLALVLMACGAGSSDDVSDDQPPADDAPDEEPDDDEVADDDGASDEPIDLVMWLGRDALIPADDFAQFESDFPNVNLSIDIVPLEDVVTEFIRASEAGRAPDVINMNGDNLAAVAAPGLLLDISDYLDDWASDDPDQFNDFFDSAVSGASYNGTPHGLALFNWGEFYMYRIDLLEAAGFDEPPTTWEGVLEVARETTRDGVYGFSQILGRGQGCNAGPMTMFMAMGGTHDDDGVMDWESDGGIYMLEYVQTLMREGLIDPANMAWDSGDKRAAFVNGNASQAIISPTIPPVIAENFEYGTEFGVATPPYREGDPDGFRHKARNNVMLVSAQTENPEHAMNAIRYLGSQENMVEVGARYVPPTLESVWSLPEFTEGAPWNEVQAAAYAELDTQPTHPRQPELYEICLDAMEDAARNPDADAAGIAKRTQDAQDELLGR